MDEKQMTALYQDLFTKLAESPRARANNTEYLDAAMRIISQNLSVLMPDIEPQELAEKVALAKVFARQLIAFFVRMVEEREANTLAQLKVAVELWTSVESAKSMFFPRPEVLTFVDAFIAKRLAEADEVPDVSKA